MVGEMVLCHQSAYDEMVGQPMKKDGNMLEVPVGNSSLSVLLVFGQFYAFFCIDVVVPVSVS